MIPDANQMGVESATTAGTRALHHRTTVFIAHDHMAYSVAARKTQGHWAVFSTKCAPLAQEGGLNVMSMVVGGDPPLLGVECADPWPGSLTLMGIVRQEAEESWDSMPVCLACQKIDDAVAQGRMAVLLTIEGAPLLGNGPDPNALIRLRTWYRLGIRSLKLVGQGWNVLTDARNPKPVSRGLTLLGEKVIREMNRLVMVIDMAHVPDPDPLFEDVDDISRNPIADSHRPRNANDVLRDISNERIRAIAEIGGVVGQQSLSSTL